MSTYSYTDGDGLAVLSKLTPVGAVDLVSDLDDAVKQIKAYLKDPVVGPESLKIGATGKVIATNSSPQAVAAGAGATLVDFDTANVDPQSCFGSSIYTAPSTGEYLAVISIKVATSASAAPVNIVHRLAILVDGVEGAADGEWDASEADHVLRITRLFQLAAGNTLRANYTLVVDSGTITVDISSDPAFTIFQVTRLGV